MLPKTMRILVEFIAAVVVASLPICGYAAVPSLYMVQNSGWMEPFFVDPASPLKPLFKSLIDASNTGRTIVGSFNQDGQVPGSHSPEIVLDSAYDATATGVAIDRLSLAQRPGGRLADADFEGTLTRGINTVLENIPGIIWILTNNKNSRNNDPRIDANTRQFAEMIRGSDYLPFAVAYPVRMPVTGRRFTERGLIIYALAYGEEAAKELEAVVARPAMRSLFTDPPFKLKHLDQATLTFAATGGQAPLDASSGPGGVLIIRGVPARGGGPMRITGSFRSDYYPQTIVSADISLAWKMLDGVQHPEAIGASIEPPTLSKLQSGGQERNVTLALSMPEIARPPGLDGLFAQSKTLNGVLELRLSRLSLALGDDFLAKMNEISALDQLPDVFSDYQRVTQATALLPVVMVVQFSPLPLIAAVSAAMLLLLLLIVGVLLLVRARRYLIPIDGRNRPFVLRPFQSTTAVLANDRTLHVTGRLFGRHATRMTEPTRKP